MINLDDKNAILKLHGGEAVTKSIDALPKQIQQSFSESLTVKFTDEYRKVKNIVVCGMGGSQWPARIVGNLFKEQIKVPYLVNSDYTLPGFVNSDTLVVLSSYSGTTEESLACGKKALELGAKLTAVTGGQDVEKMLQELNIPLYVFNPLNNPSGQPRIGFGYGVGGHLGLLLNLGFLDLDKKAVENSLNNLPELLKSFTLTVQSQNNPAKQMAQKIFNKSPYYIVGEFLAGVGNAIQNQTNENSKSISSYREIPELNHHLMEGLKHPQKNQEIALFVFLYSSYYSPAIQKRFRITKDVVEQNKIETVWYELTGKSKLDQAFELMGLGSYMTMYLSALYEEDPSVIPYVDYFKKKLKE